VGERAHDRPLALAGRSIQHVCRQALDLRNELVHAVFGDAGYALLRSRQPCSGAGLNPLESVSRTSLILGVIAYTEAAGVHGERKLAALRATCWRQRQPLAVKVAQARLTSLQDGDELLPYVLSRCAAIRVTALWSGGACPPAGARRRLRLRCARMRRQAAHNTDTAESAGSAPGSLIRCVCSVRCWDGLRPLEVDRTRQESELPHLRHRPH